MKEIKARNLQRGHTLLLPMDKTAKVFTAVKGRTYVTLTTEYGQSRMHLNDTVLVDDERWHSLSDCINYESNTRGDCGGRVEEVNGVVICENCRNRKPRISSLYERGERR